VRWKYSGSQDRRIAEDGNRMSLSLGAVAGSGSESDGGRFSAIELGIKAEVEDKL